MATNVAIDTELLELAREVGNLRTMEETVNLALKEFVDRRKQLEIVALFGTMDPDADYDYEAARRR
jgi:putative antitoxin of VapBC-like toxin-antitoxin system